VSALLLYPLILLLHLLVPARWVDGYVRDDQGRPLRYRLNGMRVLLVSVVLWALLGWLQLVPLDQLWHDRWTNLGVACAIGLIFTFAVVLPATPVRSLPVDLFLGRLENPQWLGNRVDAKMCLSLIGAVVLELNVLSFAAHHVQLRGAGSSPGLLLCTAMIPWFVLDYFTFEHVHLYTYDLFAERVGFKLGWGCLTFYPFFYTVGPWSLTEAPDPGWPVPYYLLATVVFFGGWSLARGANMQKFFFKRDPEAPFLGIQPQVGTDGDRKLLGSGFWGISRHVNYLGEIGMASGIALALGYPTTLWPWLYPLYYVLLLFPRERDDDARCAEKYGPLWEQYRERVPYRIIPFVY